MEQDDRTDHFYDILEDFRAAMLVTRTDAGLMRSRPMHVAQVDREGGEGAIWFLTSGTSGKVHDLEIDEQVNISMQGQLQYLSLSGAAEVVEDRDKIDELWTDQWKVWFPEGKDDPDLSLLKIVPEHGEFWDFEGSEMFELLFEAGRAYITDDEIDYDKVVEAQDNATVDLEDE